MKLKYCKGDIADEKAMRMVSFDTSLHGRLKKAEEEKSVILVSKCKVKPGYSSELKIYVTSTSKVE